MFERKKKNLNNRSNMFFKRGNKHIAEVIAFLALAVVIALIAYTRFQSTQVPEETIFGVTFSANYARDLGLDWRKAFIDTLDDVGVRHFRIPVSWSDVEFENGKFYWSDVDFMMDEAAARGARVTLAVGRKVPRWPECYIPDWAERLGREYQNQEVLDFLETVVMRYNDHPALVRWQVENEPFFPFGECPPPDYELFTHELDLVRSLSNKPVMITTSGEAEFWVESAIPADVLGVSMYRVTWNELLGYFVFPLGPEFYRAKAALAEPFAHVIVSELQAEPFFRDSPKVMSIGDQTTSFPPEELLENVAYATQGGFDEIHLWGVEWWYFMKVNGNDGYWETAKELFLYDL